MRFIITIEDDGYELRYWNEITEEIGDIIVKSWTQKNFYSELKEKGIKITQKEIRKSFKLLNDENCSFVVLKSADDGKIENLSIKIFTIDEALTYGKSFTDEASDSDKNKIIGCEKI